MRTSLFLAALSLPLLTATAAFANDPVVNGGFEAGAVNLQDYAASNGTAINGWVGSGNLQFTGVQSNDAVDQSVIPHSGSFAALLGPGLIDGKTGAPLGPGTLSQTITDTPGAQDTLTFWLAAECAIGPACNNGNQGIGPVTPADNSITASIAGQSLTLTNIVETGDGFFGTPDPNNGSLLNGTYFEYTLDFTATGSDTINFSFYDNNSYLALDDVSVNDAGGPGATTPEPSSLVLLGTGIVGLAGAARRRFAA